MYKLLLIALGGAAGTLARYGTQTALAGLSGRTLFPWGTLAVNLLGCLVIGYLHGVFSHYRLIPTEYRLLIMVGVLGGFTTFSSYGLETINLVHDRQYWRALANFALNNLLGLALVVVGYGLATYQASRS